MDYVKNVRIQKGASDIEIMEIKRLVEELNQTITREEAYKFAIRTAEGIIKDRRASLYQTTKKRKDLQKQVRTFWAKKSAKASYARRKILVRTDGGTVYP